MVAPLIAIGARVLATQAGRAIAARGAQAIATRIAGAEAAGGLTSLIGRGVQLSNLVQAKGPAMISAAADLAQFLSAIRPAPAPSASPSPQRAEDHTHDHVPTPGMGMRMG